MNKKIILFVVVFFFILIKSVSADLVPIPSITYPSNGNTIGGLTIIIAKDLSLENDISSVKFYYSSDNINWNLIGDGLQEGIEKLGAYQVFWDTSPL
jgi:hypothetical protein